ncbi:MAG: tetratricopeptide repeat protein [Nitrospinales bacterium]
MKNLIAVTVLMVGIIFLSFNGVQAEEDPNVVKLKALCEKGNGTACFRIGERYRTVELDNKSSILYHLKACDTGYITGCTHAGILILMTGKQYSPEWKKAAKLFAKGCDINSDRACFNLGQLKYKEGRQKACDLGNAVACSSYKKLTR